MEERNYKLYVHISPSNKRYYGITSTSVKRRWDCGRGYKGCTHFRNAINKYGWENFEHLVLFDNLTKDEACLLEQCYIALYDTTNPKYGYNSTYGGEKGVIHTEETKKKISQNISGKNHPNYGKHLCVKTREKIGKSHKGYKHTKEAKRKMSEARKGTKQPQETIEKRIESRKGYKHSQETREKISEANKGKHYNDNNRKVICIETGVIYNSLKEAELIISGKYTDCIGACCRGTNYTAHGYHWCYLEDLDNYVMPEPKMYVSPMEGKKHSEETKKKISEKTKGKRMSGDNPNAKKVKCIELNLIFNSVADANEYLGKPRSRDSISRCARGGQDTAFGYHWEYATEEQEEQVI